ncbi:hypothetical protein WAK64_09640 [Bacillus spongiae]|uniref:Uncharacterized protein n=1 Tax=Bacillus spongiae TaxID=2683610 RepID=A0ABU8HDR1_9BACI
MNKNQKPRFQIGDTIVIGIYGTVGIITDIKRMEGEILYEVNESEGLFREEVLFLLDEYEGVLVEKEQIDIQYGFFFGDLVKVKGFELDLFKVVGIRTEIWRYQDDAWEDIVYELTRVTDGEWLEADEDELSLIAESHYAEVFLKEYYILHPTMNHSSTIPSVNNHQFVDYLLDKYNDYKVMYQLFLDPQYLKKMDGILQQLKEATCSRDESA